MKSGPILDACPNCGAPLELDDDGKCRFCRAHVRTQLPWSGAGVSYQPASLVPDDVDHESVAPFIYLTLVTLGSLTRERAVVAYLGAEPGLRQKIRQVSAAVGAAGVRVRDAGLLKGSFDENLRVYTPEEIWTFDLAIDVIALLGTLDGLPGGTRASIADTLRLLSQSTHTHTWKKDLKNAGQGPEAFRELRAQVPRRA